MCAIVDANRADEVFGEKATEAGEAFLDWLIRRHGRLVVGGKVLRELTKTSARDRLQQLTLAGRAFTVDDDQVDAKTKEVSSSCRSDDPHIIALAQVSGARLLYSNDKALHQDFGNQQLIQNPRGRIYSTNDSTSFNAGRQALLRRKDLCRTGN